MEHDIGPFEQPRSAQRQQVRRPGSRADEIHSPCHSIIPAATVWLVASSIRMKAPVVRSAA